MDAYGQPDQRRATDFAFLMPGVQGNNTTGNPTTNTGVVNGSGSRGAVSNVYIDGVPFVRAGGNGDPRYVWTAISVDAVDQGALEVEVQHLAEKMLHGKSVSTSECGRADRSTSTD
jgi:hypothetical protein